MAEPVDLDLSAFAPQIVDKVLRLLGVLDAIGGDRMLASKVCLHGGTALNLFILDAPRLSVDIDLNYIGSTNLAQMQAQRPTLEQALINVTENLGFDVAAGKPEHSGRSFRLYYQGAHGRDWVKIDLDYLNRSPLLPAAPQTIRLATGATVQFLLNSDTELVAGKTKALIERVAVRDLYDISRLACLVPTLFARDDEKLSRRVLLYYLSMSAPFPRPFRIADRFGNREADLAAQLYPMLRPTDRPTLDALIATAEEYLTNVSQPHDDDEAEYLARAARADFAPELLFADYPDALIAARADPAAQWKMRNLAKSLLAE